MTAVWTVGKMPCIATIRASTGNWSQEHDNPAVLRALRSIVRSLQTIIPPCSCNLSSLYIILELIEIKVYEIKTDVHPKQLSLSCTASKNLYCIFSITKVVSQVETHNVVIQFPRLQLFHVLQEQNIGHMLLNLSLLL